MARIWITIAMLVALLLSAGVVWSDVEQANAARRPERSAPVPRVSGLSPFAPGCTGQSTGSPSINSAVEPAIAVDPLNPSHLVGVWQQDRWSNSAASGILTGVSFDRGETWTTSFAHFSLCTGGTWERASDPWVTFARNGTVLQSALTVNISTGETGVLVSSSSDGGLTWSDPITLGANGGEDKATITADPTDLRYVYAVWDGSTSVDECAIWISRSRDAGADWDGTRVLFNPGANASANGNQIVVLPNGSLLDVCIMLTGSPSVAQIAVLRSPDQGQSWSTPTIVSTDEWIGTDDPKTQEPIRSGGFESVAVDMKSGAVYVVWADARFSGGQRDGIVMSKSVDAGVSWSAPVQVNQAPGVQAFTPTVAVNDMGAVAITYYDFRKDTDDVKSLLTTCWRIVSEDGGNTWRETPVAGTFDLLLAPAKSGALFLGIIWPWRRPGMFSFRFSWLPIPLTVRFRRAFSPRRWNARRIVPAMGGSKSTGIRNRSTGILNRENSHFLSGYHKKIGPGRIFLRFKGN